MADGLKIVVGADVQEAVRAVKALAKEAGAAGVTISKSLSSGLAPAATGLNKVQQAAQQLNNTLPKTSAAFKNIIPGSNQATQSLINLSRVAQDAPFGFIGIANNLNPLLESFQRLKAETGSSAGSLTALRSALVGPAGIGLALGVVSSLLIKFGGDIFGAGNNVTDAEVSNLRYASSLKKIEEALEDFGTGLDFINKLRKLQLEAGGLTGEKLSIADAQNRIASNKELIGSISNSLLPLEEKLNKERAFGTKTIEEFVKIQGDLKEVGIGKSLLKGEKANLARVFQIIQETGTASTEIIGKLNASNQKRVNDYIATNKTFEKLSKERLGAEEENSLLELQVLIDRNKVSKDANKEFIEDQKKLAQFLQKNFLFSKGATFNIFDTDKDTIRKSLKTIQEFFNKAPVFKVPFEPLLSEPEKVKEAAIDMAKKFAEFYAAELKNISSQPERVDFSIPEAIANEKKMKAQAAALAAAFSIDISESPLTKLQKQAVFAAKSINDVLAPAFSDLFGAILQGENPIKAFFTSLGQSVTQLIQKLIAAAIQAAILSAIFPGGFGTGANAVKGFGSIFKNILGFAQGGIVSGPTLALIGEGVGTSRSNPEVVAPLDQLRAMLGDIGGGAAHVVVTGKLRGNDMALQNARTSKRQRRTTGR
jgi:hypothetical protein